MPMVHERVDICLAHALQTAIAEFGSHQPIRWGSWTRRYDESNVFECRRQCKEPLECASSVVVRQFIHPIHHYQSTSRFQKAVNPSVRHSSSLGRDRSFNEVLGTREVTTN